MSLTSDRHGLKQMKKLNHDYDEAVTAIIEEGYRDGSFRNIGPARIVGFGIIGMLNWTNRWFVPGKTKVPSEQIGAMFADLVTAGLQSGSLAGMIDPRRLLGRWLSIASGVAEDVDPPRRVTAKSRQARCQEENISC